LADPRATPGVATPDPWLRARGTTLWTREVMPWVSPVASRVGTVANRSWRLVDRDLSRPGLLMAVVFVCLSLTPSLLPRTGTVQGVICGLSATFGYATGVALAWIWSRAVGDRVYIDPRVRAAAGPVLAVSAGATLLGFSFVGSQWQRELHTLMGARPPTRSAFLVVLALTLSLLTVAIAVARVLRLAARRLGRLLGRWIPAAAAQLVGAAVVSVVVVGVLDGVVRDGFFTLADRTSAAINNSAEPAWTPPVSPLRSGSPASLAAWDTLGREGRGFVSGGPTLADLRAFGGPRAVEPIRVYAGMQSAPTTEAVAALAIRELDRTGAFDRAVLCVVITTGTGWVDPFLATALEYVHHGDTAIVGTQYSYLPSWISYLTERDRVARAGRELFQRVHARWSALPVDERPRLLLFAESLGSLFAEEVFTDVDDLLNHVDGALLTGPTSANRIRADLTEARDPGSTEVLPVYQNGRNVRFASFPSDLERPPATWHHPRLVYLQNPSDPVTWWSTDLLLSEPDWLAEPRGYDILPAMSWYPFVTFCQVTLDLALAEDAPVGHGHRFRRAGVAAWVAIAEPDGWTPAHTTRLTRLLTGG
jgi:uncharacterized membrane protein